jgi:alkylresorcinol/alkylpyrone synthase
MVNVTHVATALPKQFYSAAEILEATKDWMKAVPSERALFERFIASSKIGGRHFCLPVQRILQLRNQDERAALFLKEGSDLGCEAVSSVLMHAELSKDAVQTLVFSSCSVPTIPAVDATIVNRLELQPTIRRVPVYQHGCAGGAVGLGLGAALANSKGATLVLAAELCSLVFHSEDFSSGSLVGSALFADGAACAVLQQKPQGLEFLGTQSYLIPHSEQLMGYDLKNDGAHLRLLRELPMVLSEHAPELIRTFLGTYALGPADISSWLFHPGGVRILDNLESALNLKREQTHWAWDVLDTHGNMSSATILFVLESYLKRQRQTGSYVLMLGIGPGLTIELLLFRDTGT